MCNHQISLAQMSIQVEPFTAICKHNTLNVYGQDKNIEHSRLYQECVSTILNM